MKTTFNKRISIVSVVYLAMALLYLLLSIHGVGGFTEPLPVLLLFMTSIGYLPWRLSHSLLFAAIGDIMGCLTGVLSQTVAFVGLVGGFAMAHVFLISFFISYILKHRAETMPSKKSSRNARMKAMRGRGMYAMMVMLLVWGLLYYAFVTLIPAVPAGFLRIVTIAYAVIIAAMLFFALMTEDWVWGLGAILFTVSDILLALDIFVFADNRLNVILMALYYCAQLILFSRACTKYHLNK